MLAVAIALALLVGLSLGLLGGGGSILTLPILRYVLGMEAHDAIAVSLLVVGTTSAAAVVPHARAGRVRWRTAVIFGLAGMVGAFGAGRVAHLVPSSILLGLFGAMMMVTALAMMRGRKASPGAASSTEARELPIAKVVGEGLVVGAVTGLVGAGGGFLVVPALVLLGGLSMEVAVGTSLVVISMKSFAGFAGYLGHAEIDWGVAGLVTASAVVGSVVGGALASKVSPDELRKGFAWLVVAMAFFILGQEVPRAMGLEPPMHWVLAGTLAGVALVLGLVRVLRRHGLVAADEPRAPVTP
ncbi:MAG: sulfite exporter TauE/SafE family protein [Sandaracinus sp.]